ncbi:MAG TPA: hypothetical protein VGP72_24720 [Planctomycetota bacterium]|jgi:hypothetical protein
MASKERCVDELQVAARRVRQKRGGGVAFGAAFGGTVKNQENGYGD